MLIRLLAAFIVVPLVELYLLLRLADLTSVATTFAVVVVTGIIGSLLARREGTMAWYRFRAALAEGRVPNHEIQDGLMIVFAAALLLTPGLLTDFVGFLLLIPFGRNLFRRYVLPLFLGRVQVQVSSFESPGPSGRPRQDDRIYSSNNRHGYTIDAESVQRKT